MMDSGRHTWSYDRRKYRCCCNGISVMTGGVIIAAMNLVWAGKYLVFNILQFPWFSEQFLFGMCYFFLQLAFAIILLVGLKRHRSGFILASFVFLVVDSVLLMYMTIHLLFALSAASSYVYVADYPEVVPSWQQPISWVECCVYIALASIRIWFAAVLYRCYDYVKHLNDTATTVRCNVPETPPPPYDIENGTSNQQELFTISQGPIMEKTDHAQDIPQNTNTPNFRENVGI
ncbi:unnamed protein product [Soboliphyme baturini]|uniref:MARVEL domain-containing protein n=1 Tax=Soboliphyme baturini TaxID=241478 RepID=A0A183INW4_9BILA|nr:unnamed protein product [Soboliphyme baturini]